MLERFSLTDTRLPPGAVAALANGARMTALKTLILGGRRVDATAQRTLAAGRSLRLRELWLIGNELDHGLAALANAPVVAELESLVLGASCKDAGALAELLRSLPRLRHLRIERCVEGARVVEALQCSASTLRELSLHGVDLGEVGARRLCELGIAGMWHLELSRSGIGDRGARALAASAAPPLTVKSSPWTTARRPSIRPWPITMLAGRKWVSSPSSS